MDFGLKKRKKGNLIDISPLIDVVFLLLIFFMVTTTFLDQPGIQLDLPESQSKAQKKESDTIKVVIDSAGKVYFKGELVDIGNLGSKLDEAFKKADKKELFIEADKDSKHGDVISVMDIAKSKGAIGLTVVTKSKKAKAD